MGSGLKSAVRLVSVTEALSWENPFDRLHYVIRHDDFISSTRTQLSRSSVVLNGENKVPNEITFR